MNHNRYSVKSITIKGITERTILDKIYRSWTITDCCHTKVALEDFLEWDPYYQLDKMIKENGFGQQEVEPEECYEQANEWGGLELAFTTNPRKIESVRLDLGDLTEDTPAGYYYSWY